MPNPPEGQIGARRRQDALFKPRGSMGRLEALSIQIAGIRRQALPQIAQVIITMAGDHVVASQGVSAYPQEVAQQMVHNLLRGGVAISVLARRVGARGVVDMGVAASRG